MAPGTDSGSSASVARAVTLLVALVAAGCSSSSSGDGPDTGGEDVNAPPVVNAGADANIALPTLLALQGSYTDDGLSGPVTSVWSKVSGPGSVFFVDASKPISTASVSEIGTYVLRLTVDDGEFQASDDVTFDVDDLPGNDITPDPTTVYQTITGWEATAEAQHRLSPKWSTYKDQLFDMAVNDLGITRVRLEVRSGVENDQDYWTMWQNGLLTSTQWREVRYSTVNDNADPFVTDPSGFHFSELDDVVNEIVLPLRSRVLANGEPFHVNLCYVAFVKQLGAGLVYDHYDTDEYAEFATETYRHMNDTFGFVPNTWEILLEPDNVPGWFGTTIGKAMVALAPRITAMGYTPRFVAPSSASTAAAVNQFDQIEGVPNALDHLVEISYHRYHFATTANVQALHDRAEANGLSTAQLEFIGADYLDLHEDLKVGGGVAWQQYVLAGLSSVIPDNGTAYFIIDDSNPNAPVVKLGSRTYYLRQYFKYIRPGSVRVEATTSNPAFDPLMFARPDGGIVAVVKATTSGTFYVRDLPPGRYGITYTTGSAKGFEAPDVTLIENEILTATIPGAGVLTVYSKL